MIKELKIFQEINSKKILIAPMDWGLGHVIRCIPLIDIFIKQNNQVFVAVNKAGKEMILNHFPTFPSDHIFLIPGYDITYSGSGRLFFFKLITQLPRIYSTIQEERKWIRKLMNKHHFDVILSDNRFGCRHPDAYNILLTHQLQIQTFGTVIDKWVQRLNYHFIHQFDACWVPDLEHDNQLAGKLAHPEIKPAIPLHYIGHLSRFEYQETDRQYDICVVLSGPEPQRTILETTLLNLMSELKLKVVVIRGLPTDTQPPIKSSRLIKCVNYVGSDELKNLLLASEIVISRAGYTSIMELDRLKKKSILIPTPGQTEQLYLADFLSDHERFQFIHQENLSLEKINSTLQEFELKLPR